MNSLAIVITIFILAPPVSAAPSSNPYSRHKQYVSPHFTAACQRSKSRLSPAGRKVLERVKNAPTAIWVVSRKPLHPSKKVKRDLTKPNPSMKDLRRQKSQSLIGALADAARKKHPPIVTIIVYNLPNRDCAASASLGELCCRYLPNGRCDFVRSYDCNKGLAQYRSFIDIVSRNMRKYCGRVPMSVIVEPDSLPNLVTNLANQRCSAAGTMMSYRQGIKYAVKTLNKACKRATLYLDAAHGRWLGYEGNSDGFVKEVKALGVSHLVRGFSTNLASHNPVGKRCPYVGFCNGNQNSGHACCKNDPCNEQAKYNAGFNEINYARLLHEKMRRAIPRFNPRFIIDTSRGSTRNGSDMCGTFCNPRGAGMGVMPTTKTDDPSIIDAYLWLKVPGESDGCSKKTPNGRSCPRYDPSCGSSHSLSYKSSEPSAPEAGEWYPYQFAQLVSKATLK